jgi:hypothetical protein
MIRSSRQYSTSAKEVLRDIEDQIKAIERRNKLDQEFRKSRLESLRERGALTEQEYSTQRARIGVESRQDMLQTRLLRELIETVKTTSKEEIREGRREVERTIQESRTVGRLGVRGDEFSALKETVQQDLLSGINQQEIAQRGGFNLGGLGGAIMAGGGALARGNLLRMGGFLGGAGIGTAATALPFAILTGGAMAGMDSTEQLRRYMMATQIPAGGGGDNVLSRRVGYEGLFRRIGLGTEEGMNIYGDFMRSYGGGRLSENQLLTLASMTRARDISPELLGQTLGFQRYSNTGSAATIVSSFESALRRLYPEEFKRKLVQLPEMIGVYNSLAQQMLQVTGAVNTQALSNFVVGVREGFGVEGANLQRYATGFLRGFSGSQNNYISKLQFSSLRQAYGRDLTYQESLERLEDPTASPEYMRAMAATMQRQGLPQFRAWVRSMGFGAREAREFYETGNFEKMIASMEAGTNKTVPSDKELMNTYYSEARSFQNDIKATIDIIKDAITTDGVEVALTLDYFTSGDFERDFKKLSPETRRGVLENLFTAK